MTVDLGRTFLEVTKRPQHLEGAGWSYLAQALGESDPWSSLLANALVVVLGEAGAGKTEEFRQQVVKLRRDGMSAFFIPIEDLARRELDRALEPADLSKFDEWKGSDQRGYFFLDSLDEARLGHSSLRDALTNLHAGLGACIDRASIFLSCRSSDWRFESDPDEITRLLSREKKKEKDNDQAHTEVMRPQLRVVYLAPLTEDQISTLARHFGVTDGLAFLAAINAAEAMHFAGRPLDVKWLAEYWSRRGSLGNLTELIQANIDEKLREVPFRPGALSVERKLEGTKRIAGVLLLASRQALLLPSATADAQADSMAVDVTRLLPEWEPAEIEALLTLPIFDLATHGKVRFHHRAVQDFLAGAWLSDLLEHGIPRRALESLFFREVEGVLLVPGYLRPALAWLALNDSELRFRTIVACPEVLFEFGDPAALTLKDRESAVASFAERFGARGKAILHFDRGSLRRFASKRLAAVLCTLLRDPRQGPQVKETLLEIALEGKIEAVVDAALELASDENIGEGIRFDAMRLVGKVGTAEQREVLAALKDKAKGWGYDLVGAFIEALFPGPLKVNEFLSILQQLPAKSENLHTFLDSTLAYRIPEKLESAERRTLILQIHELLNTNANEEGEPGNEAQVRENAALLFPMLVSLLNSEVRGWKVGDGAQDFVIPVLEDVSTANRAHGRESNGLSELKALINGSPAVKQRLFWRSVERAKERKEAFKPRYFEVLEPYSLFDLSKEDLPWLQVDALEKVDVLDRLMAFDALIYLALRMVDRPVGEKLIEEVAGLDPALSKRWQRMTAVRPPASVEALRHQRLERLRSAKLTRQHEQNSKYLEEKIEKLRSGEDFGALWFLLRRSTTHLSSWGDANPAKVAEEFGQPISDAFAEGIKEYWKTSPAFLPSRRKEDGVPNGTVLSLAGLALSFSDGLNASDLSSELAEKAISHALWELNAFPDWLVELARTHGEKVGEIISSEIAFEYDSLKAGNQRSYSLIKLCRADEAIRRLCAPALRALLAKEEEPDLEPLMWTMEAIFSIESLKFDEFGELASRKCAQHVKNPDRYAVWWSLWVNWDGEAALGALEAFIQEIGDEKADVLVLQLAHRMHEWSERYRSIQWRMYEDIDALKRLFPILWDRIRLEEDLEHEGVYSPGPRDNAQDVRSRVLHRIAALPTIEARDALECFAKDGRFEKIRDYILHLVDEHGKGEIAGGPLTVEDAIKWGDQAPIKITSSRGLFDIVRNRLDDVSHFLRTGEFSYRELFSMDGMSRPPESAVQKWLAAELTWASRRQYSVHREEEVGRKRKPDLRLSNASCSGPVCIEVKLAEDYSVAQLVEALEKQLVGQYLESESSRFGVLLLCSIGKPKQWVVDGRRRVDFPAVVERLQTRADRICKERAAVEGLIVVALDFH